MKKGSVLKPVTGTMWLIFGIIAFAIVSMGLINHDWAGSWIFWTAIIVGSLFLLFSAATYFQKDWKLFPRLADIGGIVAITLILLVPIGLGLLIFQTPLGEIKYSERVVANFTIWFHDTVDGAWQAFIHADQNVLIVIAFFVAVIMFFVAWRKLAKVTRIKATGTTT